MIIIRISALFGAFLLLVVVVACDGGGSSRPRSIEQVEAEGTLDAAMATAESADVSNVAKEYASDWCQPLRNFFDEFVELAPELEGLEESEDIGSFMVIMRALEEPIVRLVEDVEDIQPPREFQEYQQGFLAELLYGVEAIKLMSEGGLFAALALGDPPPTAEAPPDLENALILECGEELSNFISDEAFLDFFAEEDGPSASSAEGETLALGSPIEISAGELPSYLFDSPNPAGRVLLTFTGFETGITSVEDEPYGCRGTEFAKGQFVAVFFSFENDLSETVQMSSVVNRETKLQDDRGRTWERAEVVRSDLCVLEPNISAQYINGEQIAASVGPGFTETSAIAFDIPADATGLVLIEATTKARIPLE